MMATRQWDGGGFIQAARSGHWNRALDTLGRMYSNRLEIKDRNSRIGVPSTSTFPTPARKPAGSNFPFPVTTPPYVNAPSSNLPVPILHQNDASKNLIQTFSTNAAANNVSQGSQLAQMETLNAQNRSDTFNQLETPSRGTAESGDLNMPPVNLTFNITIQGDAKREEVEAGVRQTVPMFRESMDDWWKSHRHEMQRRGFDW